MKSWLVWRVILSLDGSGSGLCLSTDFFYFNCWEIRNAKNVNPIIEKKVLNNNSQLIQNYHIANNPKLVLHSYVFKKKFNAFMMLHVGYRIDIPSFLFQCYYL